MSYKRSAFISFAQTWLILHGTFGIALQSQGLVEQGVVDAARNRGLAFHHRMRKPGNPLSKVSTQPTVPLTTASLDNIRHVGVPEADCIKVLADASVNHKTDQRLGRIIRSFPSSHTMDGAVSCLSIYHYFNMLSTDILREVLATWNVAWEKHNSRSLQVCVSIDF
jgi:hypothetical protein